MDFVKEQIEKAVDRLEMQACALKADADRLRDALSGVDDPAPEVTIDRLRAIAALLVACGEGGYVSFVGNKDVADQMAEVLGSRIEATVYAGKHGGVHSGQPYVILSVDGHLKDESLCAVRFHAQWSRLATEEEREALAKKSTKGDESFVGL